MWVGAVLAGSTPPFVGRERAAVDVDVGPERRSPRYHETYLALESIKEGSAAVSNPCKESLPPKMTISRQTSPGNGRGGGPGRGACGC